ncbi:hypothetical protein BV25DRAFT_705953 [Artomyces pyxidatus]|uniref:Uncharacterized protein n=1 Tax=Artomyces pyxidatus TaxID=48021 RepID=A0ACB8SZB5_9AGAM|nr:hypothetical protein BV25DRAFT_705953 [Artomyces pyxidatus]
MLCLFAHSSREQYFWPGSFLQITVALSSVSFSVILPWTSSSRCVLHLCRHLYASVLLGSSCLACPLQVLCSYVDIYPLNCIGVIVSCPAQMATCAVDSGT